MILRSFLPVVLITMTACAASSSDSVESVDALEQAAPLLTGEALRDATSAEGETTVLFQIDDGATTKAAGENAEYLETLQPSGYTTVRLTAMTKPVFRVQLTGPFRPGTFACSEREGSVAIRTDTVSVSSTAQPCTISITSVGVETLPAHALAVGMRPRTIATGFASAIVTDKTTGATHDVRAGFTVVYVPGA